MKFNISLLVLLIASSSALSWADNSVNYRYSGDSVGRQVCRAIVRDDPERLQQVLRFHRSTLVYRYTIKDLSSRSIAGSFKCNDVALVQFSQRVGAQKILDFLTEGNATVENQEIAARK